MSDHDTPPPSLRSAVPSSGRVAVEGPLVVATIAGWHRRLDEVLSSTGELTIDLSGITDTDLFGLQLLWSLRRTAETQGRRVVFGAPPPCVEASCKAAGFDGAKMFSS